MLKVYMVLEECDSVDFCNFIHALGKITIANRSTTEFYENE